MLACTEATLTNGDGKALACDGLTVDDDLFLSKAKVTGQVSLFGAHIGGQLACNGATLTNEGREALVQLHAELGEEHDGGIQVYSAPIHLVANQSSSHRP